MGTKPTNPDERWSVLPDQPARQARPAKAPDAPFLPSEKRTEVLFADVDDHNAQERPRQSLTPLIQQLRTPTPAGSRVISPETEKAKQELEVKERLEVPAQKIEIPIHPDVSQPGIRVLDPSYFNANPQQNVIPRIEPTMVESKTLSRITWQPLQHRRALSDSLVWRVTSVIILLLLLGSVYLLLRHAF